MSLRSDVSQAGRDAAPAGGTRLQHVLQVGTNVHVRSKEDRTYVTYAELSEMHKVLETAIAESLKWIRGKGRNNKLIEIKAEDSDKEFHIWVFLSDSDEDPEKRVLFQGMSDGMRLNEWWSDDSEEGLLATLTTRVQLSKGKKFEVRYQRKLDGE